MLCDVGEQNPKQYEATQTSGQSVTSIVQICTVGGRRDARESYLHGDEEIGEAALTEQLTAVFHYRYPSQYLLQL